MSLDLPPSSNSLKSALLNAFGSSGAGAFGVFDLARPLSIFAFCVARLVLWVTGGGVTFPGSFSNGGVFSELRFISMFGREASIAAISEASSLGPILAISVAVADG
jgi:hypothetical protein